MLLHYAIRIVKKNPSRNDSKELSNLDFKLTSAQLEKIGYMVFGFQCQHLQNNFIDLAKVVAGFNSANRQYQCPFCNIIYMEISDFSPHDLQEQISQDFHEAVDKISILYGKLLSNLKRNKKRFGDPLIANGIKKEIQELFQFRMDDQIQSRGQLNYLIQREANINLNQNLMEQENSKGMYVRDESYLNQEQKKQIIEKKCFQFYSQCLLDNVNIIIPVRHKDCEHIDAYDLTSLITYQIENYKNLSDNMKKRETNQLLPCLQKGCRAVFPIHQDKLLLNCLTLDFDYLKLSKKSYPGNQIYYASVLNQQVKIQDLIEHFQKKKDNLEMNHIEEYWKSNEIELQQYLNFSNFQKSVLEKMITIMNLDLPKTIKDQINMYKFGNYEMIYGIKKLQKFANYLYQEIVYPVRCIQCEIPRVKDGEEKYYIKNMDIRTFICYALHQQLKAKSIKDYTSKFVCPLCEKESKKVLASIQFNNELMYYDSQLFQRVTKIGRIILGTQYEFSYIGRNYLLESFKNVLKYTKANYIDDYCEFTQQQNCNIVHFRTINCSLMVDLTLHTAPIINFKCKNQTRMKFDSFYVKFRSSNYSFGDGIKLCRCENDQCEKVTEIEGQLYYDFVFEEAYKKKQIHENCKFGFSYNFETQEFKEYKNKDEYIFIKLNPPFVRVKVEEVDDSVNILTTGKSFKQSQPIQMQE